MDENLSVFWTSYWCCVTNYPKAHHLNNKHLSFLIVSVVCEFDRKLGGQSSCELSQEAESEENQDGSPLKSLFGLEGVCKTACSQGWQISTACWWGLSSSPKVFFSDSQHGGQLPLQWWSKSRSDIAVIPVTLPLKVLRQNKEEYTILCCVYKHWLTLRR